MPNSATHDTMYIGAQSAPLLNVASLYDGGSLGHRATLVGKEYQTVKCDSGPASVAAGDVAFWKDRANFVVTNKLADAPEGRNSIAGMFPAAITPGNYCRVQIGGRSYVPVKTAGAPNQGMQAVPNSGTAADVVGIPAGTAATYKTLGTFTGEPSGGFTAVEITIGSMAANP